jgi:hypothetical protein
MSDDFKTLVEQGAQAAHDLDFAAAEAAYRAAVQLRPDNSPILSALGLLLLAQERYAEAWPLYEHRKSIEKTHIEASGIPEWQGQKLKGRALLIWPEQGFGDEIQMARYAPLLRKAGEVVLVCAPPLERLFKPLGVKVLPFVDRLVVPRVHFYVRNFSLPDRFGTTLRTIPRAPYLKAPSDPKTGGVGFVWRGDPSHPNDANRSLPSADLLAPLAEVADLIDLQQPRGDFRDTAARIQALDLVITVDTSMAHLAGALGVPCWVMLPARGTDWRWGRQRTDSPWYPSLKLYRQSTPGDWSDVVARLRADLAAGPPRRRLEP